MRRTSLTTLALISSLFVGLPVGHAWDGLETCEPVGFDVLVKQVGGDFSFNDFYFFDEGEGLFLRYGEVCTGGGTFTYVVTRYVEEQRTRIETRQRIVIVDGIPVVETYEVAVTYTVQVPVQETREAVLPEVKGIWKALNLCYGSVWSIHSYGENGLVTGQGTTHGDCLDGYLFYWGVPNIPNGLYRVSGKASAPDPE